MSKKTNSKTVEFEWPEFSSDSRRIKAYSKRYKNLSITEAFEACYNIQLSDTLPENVNFIPGDLKVGDFIQTKILSINKNGVVFDAANCKTNLQSAVNLYKYEKFKHFLPMDTITAVVTRKDKNKAVIDPIAPMIHEWLDPILADTSIQKVMPDGNGINTAIIVKDLKLGKGGFIGKAVIPNASEFVGEEYTMDAFIPGSQIVLNITEDFEQFNGKSVAAFVVNYMKKPGSNDEMSLICSAKEVIKFAGECNMINIFNSWCEESDLWKQISNTTFKGKVTGVINTSKKCGVFIEIPDLSITGMVQTKPDELVNYKPHSEVDVKLTGFDEEMFYNSNVGQMQHVDPYVIEDGCLKKCNLKPILQFA